MDLFTNLASSFGSLAPYHLLLYSTLLGTEIFQTFVNTKVCFDALPRSAFTTLQKRIFPIYFRGQAVLLLLSAVTFPPHGLPSLTRQMADWIPYAVAGTTSLLNLFLYEPKTRRAMIDCIHQGTDSSGTMELLYYTQLVPPHLATRLLMEQTPIQLPEHGLSPGKDGLPIVGVARSRRGELVREDGINQREIDLGELKFKGTEG
ncbi:hypothetical protein MMYC01_203888 [Madurella mycetomatis]|uniref:TMEM205-like domain-containing protein n=1 Tax=Madurella mycetomatis TaxID=100816 RepID=A0A175WBV1_9PEZI|nr:hypothetical protein MMYC01_203888 [Madurella mycetomatis]